MRNFNLFSSVSKFNFKKPTGMKCGLNPANGHMGCKWVLTDQQKAADPAFSHNFCYSATSQDGVDSETRCFKVVHAEQPKKITNIKDMANAVLDGSGWG